MTNELIAEKVMGWDRDDSGNWWEPVSLNVVTDVTPDFMGDPGEAWTVVERMRALGFHPYIALVDQKWTVAFHPTAEYSQVESSARDTMPLAVCEAALKALEGEKR